MKTKRHLARIPATRIHTKENGDVYVITKEDLHGWMHDLSDAIAGTLQDGMADMVDQVRAAIEYGLER